jgi:hypothetical protein
MPGGCPSGRPTSGPAIRSCRSANGRVVSAELAIFSAGRRTEPSLPRNFLHSLGACFGAYLLALRLVRNRPAPCLRDFAMVSRDIL